MSFGVLPSLSQYTLDVTQVIPINYFGIERDGCFSNYYHQKKLPYWLHDHVKHATCLTEQVALKKAPNIHEAGPSTAGLGSSRNGVPGLLAKPSALGG